MYVFLDLTAPEQAPRLNDRENFQDFHVEVRGATDTQSLDQALRAADLGVADEEGQAYLLPESVRILAGDDRGAAWDEQFDGMVDYARSKGWWNEEHRGVAGHVVWVDEPKVD